MNSGTINFTGSAVSKGTVTLSGGNLETSSTFYVSAGSLSGVGTIIGNLSTDDYNADGSGSGTISPGLGQLNVTGNFTMTANGSFNVIINALGTTSVLNITGSATLNGGTLNVTNNWRSGAQNFTFMQYGSHTGSFAYYMIDVSSWQFQGQTYNLALLAPGASNYQLQSS